MSLLLGLPRPGRARPAAPGHGPRDGAPCAPDAPRDGAPGAPDAVRHGPEAVPPQVLLPLQAVPRGQPDRPAGAPPAEDVAEAAPPPRDDRAAQDRAAPVPGRGVPVSGLLPAVVPVRRALRPAPASAEVAQPEAAVHPSDAEEEEPRPPQDVDAQDHDAGERDALDVVVRLLLRVALRREDRGVVRRQPPLPEVQPELGREGLPPEVQLSPRRAVARQRGDVVRVPPPGEAVEARGLPRRPGERARAEEQAGGRVDVRGRSQDGLAPVDELVDAADRVGGEQVQLVLERRRVALLLQQTRHDWRKSIVRNRSNPGRCQFLDDVRRLLFFRSRLRADSTAE